MPWFSAVVMFAVIWVMTFLVLLPVGIRTQGEEGQVEPGTHAGAPVNFQFVRLAKRVSLIAIVLWGILFSVATWGGFTLADVDFFHRLTPPSN